MRRHLHSSRHSRIANHSSSSSSTHNLISKRCREMGLHALLLLLRLLWQAWRQELCVVLL
jgi:hypothetical protein